MTDKENTMSAIQQVVSGAQMANSAASVASSLARPRTAASTTGTGSTSTTSAAAASAAASASATAASSTITANDFLTLLVAEMKNQDPTQPTDPTAYISQMVDVNSLQQLVGINAGITSLDTAAGASTTGTGAVSGTGS